MNRTGRWHLRFILVLLGAGLASLSGLGGCAATASGAGERGADEAAVQKADAKLDPERRMGRWVREGAADSASRFAEALMRSQAPRERLVGAYWKAVSLVHLERHDSALALLRAYRGRWGGVMREVGAETLLRALSAGSSRDSEARPQGGAASGAVSAAPSEKAVQNRLEALERRTGELQGEVERLQAEKQRYDKLLRELDRMP